MKKTKDKRRIMWYLIGIGAIFLMLLIIISSIISLGERLGRIHAFVEYGFYILSFLIIYFLFLRPILIVLRSPSFSVKTVLEKDSKKNYGLYKKITKNIVKSNVLKEKENNYLLDSMNDYNNLKHALNLVFNSSLKREINKCIIKNAKTVMISTALCPNGRLDLLTVLTVNLKMIKEIVQMCGFRPNYKNLSKLSINILITALIAEGMENVKIDDFLPNNLSSSLGEVPLLKPLLSSVTQGVTNALLTVRIGIVCRKYLFKEGEEITRDKIRKQALKEAVKLLPFVVKDTITFFPQKIIKMFSSNDDTEEYA
ncbi:MAG: YcjF family protein [Erysipelotrichales bacterium]|nr:YcjF family protein [Erysipelotrichales bacterium]